MVPNTSKELRTSAEHCLSHNSIMRYVDVGEAARFIKMVRKQRETVLSEDGLRDRSLEFDNVFPDIKSVTLHNIKTYYCRLLRDIKSDAVQKIKDAFSAKMTPRYKSTVHLTTSDAHTITDVLRFILQMTLRSRYGEEELTLGRLSWMRLWCLSRRTMTLSPK